MQAHGVSYGFCTILGLLGERDFKEWGHFHVLSGGIRKRKEREITLHSRMLISAVLAKLRKKLARKKKSCQRSDSERNEYSTLQNSGTKKKKEKARRGCPVNPEKVRTTETD